MKSHIGLRFTVYGLRFHRLVSSIFILPSSISTAACLALLLLFTTPGIAQKSDTPSPSGRPERMEKLESMKIAFFTERLNLTPDEAKAFWPVYNAFQAELEKLRNEHRETLLNARDNIDKLSDKEIEKLVDNELIFRQNELDVFKKYSSQFKKALPIRKVAKLYRAEEDWKRKILDMWREKKEEKMNR